MTDVAVVMPWTDDGCEHRARARRWVTRRWTAIGWPIVHGRSRGAEYSRSRAIIDGAHRTDAEVLVIADADVWCDRIAGAVDELAADPDRGWAVPHRDVHRLTEDATAAVLAGADPHESMPLTTGAYLGHPFGGLVVVTRPVLELVPDPRFVGWGHEDDSACRALITMIGPPLRPTRIDGPVPLWHLWHPPQPTRRGNRGPKANRALWNRYRARTNNRARMAALIKEGRT